MMNYYIIEIRPGMYYKTGGEYYITTADEIIKARRFKHLKTAIKYRDRIIHYYEQELTTLKPELKELLSLKVLELTIETKEVAC